MLQNWAEVMSCKWITDNELINTVLETIKDDEKKLPTPLNIQQFAAATSDLNIRDDNKKKLLTLLEQKSRRIPEMFAQEIRCMIESGEIDKILFLCFPFISEWFPTDFVKLRYVTMLEYFNIRDNYAFEKLCFKFQDKIESDRYVKFSHPSYSEALPLILFDEHGIPTNIYTEFFSKVLLKLADYKDAAEDICFFIVDFHLNDLFRKFSEEVRNELLLKLANYEVSINTLSWIVGSISNILTKDVRNALLLKLAEYDVSGEQIASSLIDDNPLFYDLTEEVRNELLLKLAKHNKAAYNVVWSISTHFSDVSEEIRNEILLNLADSSDEELVAYIVQQFRSKADEFPDELKRKLFKED
jgi:hypothetical protein